MTMNKNLRDVFDERDERLGVSQKLDHIEGLVIAASVRDIGGDPGEPAAKGQEAVVESEHPENAADVGVHRVHGLIATLVELK